MFQTRAEAAVKSKQNAGARHKSVWYYVESGILAEALRTDLIASAVLTFTVQLYFNPSNASHTGDFTSHSPRLCVESTAAADVYNCAVATSLFSLLLQGCWLAVKTCSALFLADKNFRQAADNDNSDQESLLLRLLMKRVLHCRLRHPAVRCLQRPQTPTAEIFVYQIIS